MNSTHRKNDVQEDFLRNSNKYYPQDFRDPGLAYIALYLLKMKVKERAYSLGFKVGMKHGCLLSKLHSFPSCFFLLIISSLTFLRYFLMQRYSLQGSRSCFMWSVFYGCLFVYLRLESKIGETRKNRN